MSELNKITIDGIEYDLPSGGGGSVPENVVLHGPSEEEVEVPPIDADMLGGELPDHYENELYLANESTPSTPSPRDADTLGGQLPSYYATNESLMRIGNVELIMDAQKLTTGNSYPLLTNATNYKELYFVFNNTADNISLLDVKRIHTLFAIGVSNRLSGRYDVAEEISSIYQIGISTNGQVLNCAYVLNSNPSYELMMSIYGCL